MDPDGADDRLRINRSSVKEQLVIMKMSLRTPRNAYSQTSPLDRQMSRVGPGSNKGCSVEPGNSIRAPFRRVLASHRDSHHVRRICTYVVLIVNEDLALCGLIGAQFSPKRHPSVLRPSLRISSRRVSRARLFVAMAQTLWIYKILIILQDMTGMTH